MPKAMLKKFRIGSTQKIMLKCPPISLFRLIGGHFFAFFGKNSQNCSNICLLYTSRAFGAASVGNEDEVILGENDAFLDAVYLALNGFCYFLSIVDFKDNVLSLIHI